MKTLYEGILNDFDTAINTNDDAVRERGLLKYYFTFSTTYANPYNLYVLDQVSLKRATKKMTSSTEGRYKYMDERLRGLVTWIENINIYDLGLDSETIYKKESSDILNKAIKRKIQSFFKIKLDAMRFDISTTADGNNVNLWFTWQFTEVDGEKQQISSSILFKNTDNN